MQGTLQHVAQAGALFLRPESKISQQDQQQRQMRQLHSYQVGQTWGAAARPVWPHVGGLAGWLGGVGGWAEGTRVSVPHKVTPLQGCVPAVTSFRRRHSGCAHTRHLAQASAGTPHRSRCGSAYSRMCMCCSHMQLVIWHVGAQPCTTHTRCNADTVHFTPAPPKKGGREGGGGVCI